MSTYVLPVPVFNPLLQRLRVWAALCALVLLGACATGPRANPNDPLEPFNRSMWSFNERLDEYVLKPVATTYKEVVPTLARRGVNNFFSNLQDGWTFVNAVLQLKPQEAVESLLRFEVNTIFGIAGLIDVATELNIERHKEDFGRTLGRWGVPSGPYLVLPFFGPSTVRDLASISINSIVDPVLHMQPNSVRNSLYFGRLVDVRARLLGATSVLDEAALDKYSFTRDVFLQVRRRQDFGDSPEEEEAPPPEPEAK